MFGNSSYFISIFLILIGLAFLIYRIQVIVEIIKGFDRWMKRKKKYEADKEKYSKPSTEIDEILLKDDISNSPSIDVTIQLLKIDRNNTQYLVYFSVSGGSILIDKIISNDFNLISIEPRAYLEENSSGHFVFTIIPPEKNSVEFEMIFEDKYTTKYSAKYLLSISENTLKKID